MVTSSTLRITNVATTARAQVTATAIIWEIKTGPPSSKPKRLAIGKCPGGPGGKNSGKHGSQRAAYAMDAENVERIVIAK